MEISLPGEQVMPLPKKSTKNKNKNKNKPNGFICFANAQKTKLAAQYNIKGPQMLVTLCDPLWRELTPDQKRMWNDKAKEEHARQTGRASKYNLPGTDPSLRKDCNGMLICERQNAERAEDQRRVREMKYVRQELDRCDEIMDLVFYIVDSLTIVEYLEGECVPCEIAVSKCTIRDGIVDSFHFFPDPGALRPGHFAEALERCELHHEIPPNDFPLASQDYEGDVSKFQNMVNGRGPKTPLLFARSSEAKTVESCLEWLGYRVSQEFKHKVMQLESFIIEVVEYTKNTPPTFAQVRRLLFETKFDFIEGNRCEFHGQTDKIACAIGNCRKYFYFMSELLYDYYEFDLIEGHHMPVGFDNKSYASSTRTAYSQCSSIRDDESMFDDVSSVCSNFSYTSYVQNRNHVPPPRRPATEASLGNKKKETDGSCTPELLSQVSNCSLDSNNSHNSFSNGPRRPKQSSKPDCLTYDKPISGLPTGYKAQSVNSFSGVATPSTARSMSPVGFNSCKPTSIGRSYTQPTTLPNNLNYSAPPPRARGYNPSPQQPTQPAPMSVSCTVGTTNSGPQKPVSVGRGRGIGRGSGTKSNLQVPRKPNVGTKKEYQYD